MAMAAGTAVVRTTRLVAEKVPVLDWVYAMSLLVALSCTTMSARESLRSRAVAGVRVCLQRQARWWAPPWVAVQT